MSQTELRPAGQLSLDEIQRVVGEQTLLIQANNLRMAEMSARISELESLPAPKPALVEHHRH